MVDHSYGSGQLLMMSAGKGERKSTYVVGTGWQRLPSDGVVKAWADRGRLICSLLYEETSREWAMRDGVVEAWADRGRLICSLLFEDTGW